MAVGWATAWCGGVEWATKGGRGGGHKGGGDALVLVGLSDGKVATVGLEIDGQHLPKLRGRPLVSPAKSLVSPANPSLSVSPTLVHPTHAS